MTIVRGAKTNRAIKTTVLLGAIALFLALIISTSIKASADKVVDVSSDQARALGTLNDIRSSRGVNPLNWNDKLAQTANFKARDIIDRGYFDHRSPDGEMIWKTIESDGYNYLSAGENLAIDFKNVNEAYDSWIKSPAHMDNIISNKYSDFGFGVAEGSFEGRSTKVYVQIFASPEPIYEQLFTNIGGNNG